MRIRCNPVFLGVLAVLFAPGIHAAQFRHWAHDHAGPRVQVQRWHALPPERRRQIRNTRRQFQQLSPQAQRRLWAEYRRRHAKGHHGGR
ncbi:MAG: DUF3106 domain-containing protein [Acidiferrobacteraceae bacterium]